MMTTVDIDQAFRVLNLEPLYGHTPHNPPTFRRAPAFLAYACCWTRLFRGG